MRKLALLLGLTALVALLWTLLNRTDLPHGPPSMPPAQGDAEGGDGRSVTPRIDRDGRTPPIARTAAPEASLLPQTPGRLHVVVVLRETDRGLSHAAVHVHCKDGRPEADSHRVAVTDAQGLVVFDALAPGHWLVHCDRGPDAEVELQAGETRELRLAVDPGVDALVRSVDAQGAAVPHAEVLLWPANPMLDIPLRKPGEVIGATDVQGELRVQALPSLAGHGSWLAAHHDGFGVSEPVMVDAKRDDGDRSERDVVLQLGVSGARLELLVVDTEGRAITGAHATALPVDAPEPAFDATPRRLRSVFRVADSDGRGLCALAPLATGDHLIRVEAAGHAPFHERLLIAAGTTTTRNVRLAHEAQLEGRITDDHGAPIDDAEVRIQLEPEGAIVHTGADGRFSIRRLCSGEADWIASHPAFRGKEGTVVLAADATASLEVQLEPLPILRAHFVDEHDKALVGWSVRLHLPPDSQSSNDHRLTTDRDGNIAIAVEAERDFALELRQPGLGMPLALAAQPSLRVTAEPTTVRVPDSACASAFLDGTLVDHDGHSLLERYVLSIAGNGSIVHQGLNLPTTERDPASGHFRLGPLPPGRYRLNFASQADLEFARPDLDLHAGEVLRLGRIEPPVSGQLQVELTLDGELRREEIMVEIQSATTSDITPVDPQSLHAGKPLLPGHYEVTIYGTGFRWPIREIDVVAGETVTLRETLHPAARVGLRAFMPEGEAGANFKVRDAQGGLAFETDLEAGTVFEDNWPFLDRGLFEVECVGASGKRYRARFTIDSLEPRTTPVELHVIPVDR